MLKLILHLTQLESQLATSIREGEDTELMRTRKLSELETFQVQETEAAVAQMEAETAMQEQKVSELLNQQMLKEMSKASVDTLTEVSHHCVTA